VGISAFGESCREPKACFAYICSGEFYGELKACYTYICSGAVGISVVGHLAENCRPFDGTYSSGRLTGNCRPVVGVCVCAVGLVAEAYGSVHIFGIKTFSAYLCISCTVRSAVYTYI